MLMPHKSHTQSVVLTAGELQGHGRRVFPLPVVWATRCCGVVDGCDFHHNEPPLLGPRDSEGTGHMLRVREWERDIEENKLWRQTKGGRKGDEWESLKSISALAKGTLALSVRGSSM